MFVILERQQWSLNHGAQKGSSLKYDSFCLNNLNSTNRINKIMITESAGSTGNLYLCIQSYNAPFLCALHSNLWFLSATLLKTSIRLQSSITWIVRKRIYGCYTEFFERLYCMPSPFLTNSIHKDIPTSTFVLLQRAGYLNLENFHLNCFNGF